MDALVTKRKAAYDNFINSIRTETTKERYEYLLTRYMKYHKFASLEELLPKEPKVVESDIIRYVVWLRQEQKLSAITINQYIAAVMHFYAMNDITLNRKKIGRYMGEYVRDNKDRAYNHKEISQLIGFCDERARALVFLLASTGIRIGAIPSLQLRHLNKITQQNLNPPLYRITIYFGTKEEYYCFTTPEAAAAIDNYLDYRVRTGEKLADNSPLFRKQYDSRDFGKIRRPEFLNVNLVNKLLEDRLIRSGIRTKVTETETMKHGQRRNPVARAHGFRKFVTTNMVRAKLIPEAREMLLGHCLPGNTGSYYRPDESELLEEYLKAVDLLTINEENRLRREVEILKVEKSKMDELEDEINKLKLKFS